MFSTGPVCSMYAALKFGTLPGVSVHAHLDLVAFDAHRVRGDPHAGVISPAPVGQVKLPAVPGTGHSPVGDEAVAERGALVGARVVGREVGPLVEEDGD